MSVMMTLSRKDFYASWGFIIIGVVVELMKNMAKTNEVNESCIQNTSSKFLLILAYKITKVSI